MDNYLKLLTDYAEAKYGDNPQEIYEKKWKIEKERKERLKDVLIRKEWEDDNLS